MRRLATIVSCLALFPAAAYAQMGGMAGEDASSPVLSAARASATNYNNWLMAAFDSMPANLYSYKPTPAQMTVGAIAAHLVQGNYLFCGNLSGTHRSTGSDEGDRGMAEASKDTLVSRLRESFEFCNSALAHMTDANLGQDIPMFGNRRAPRARVLIVYLTDLADHYSQVANYMRLNHLTPPSALGRRGM